MIALETTVRNALSGSYEILRQIGAGGMGVVYLADDLKHKRKVAIKVVYPGPGNSPQSQRFLREIDIVARLTHPGILPVFDSGNRDGVLFFVMPYVEGGSLRDLLDRERQLPLDQALSLVSEIGQALAYAHAGSVIHRDLKPANILLHGGRPVIADFGLALAIDRNDPRVSASGVGVGTPAYMSPEQGAGDTVDTRTDIYALACVLFEMLCGEPPISGSTARVVIARKLAGEIPSLRVLRPTVPDAVEAAVRQALQPVPADRFATVDRFLTALRAPPPRRRLAGGLALAGVAAVLTWVVAGNREPAIDPNLVMVAQLENRTGDSTLEALGASASDWIIQGLHGTRAATVIPTPSALQVSRFVRRDTAGRTDPLTRLARETGAGSIISGFYDDLEGKITFHVQMATASRRWGTFGDVRIVLRTALPAVSASRDSVSTAIMQVRSKVMGLLAASDADAGLMTPQIDRAPPTYDAYLRFVEGMDGYVATDGPRAVRGFLGAYERDTSFVVALLYAALTMSNMQQYAAEDSVLQIVGRSADQLSTYHRLWLEYRVAFVAGDRPRALRAVRALAAEAPRSKAVYNLAVEAWEGGHLQEALAALQTLTPGQGAMRDFLPYWAALANVKHQLGQYRGALSTARAAQRAHPGSPGPIGWEMGAMAALGDTMAVLRRAENLSRAPADPLSTSPGEALRDTGDELAAHGYRGAAAAVWGTAERWFRIQSSSAPLPIRDRLSWIATLCALGALDDADSVSRTLAVDFPQDPRVVAAQGAVAARQGRQAEARAALTTLSGIGPRYQLGRPAYYAAIIATLLGDTELALQLLGRAMAEGRPYGQWVHREPDLVTLRPTAAFQELTRPVRQ